VGNHEISDPRPLTVNLFSLFMIYSFGVRNTSLQTVNKGNVQLATNQPYSQPQEGLENLICEPFD